MSTSYTFLFQLPRAIEEADLGLFRANRALTLVRVVRHLLEVEGPEEDLKAVASALGPDWVSHPTSTTPLPGPEVGHPVPFPADLIAVTHPALVGDNTEALLRAIIEEVEMAERARDAAREAILAVEAVEADRAASAAQPLDISERVRGMLSRVSRLVEADRLGAEAMSAYVDAQRRTNAILPGLPLGTKDAQARMDALQQIVGALRAKKIAESHGHIH